MTTWCFFDKTGERRTNSLTNTYVQQRTPTTAFSRSRRRLDDERHQRRQNMSCAESACFAKLLPVRPRLRLSSSMLKVSNIDLKTMFGYFFSEILFAHSCIISVSVLVVIHTIKND